MKKLNLFLIAFSLIVICPQSSNSQILKKLQKKVQQAVEESVTDKAAEKAARETGKAMDSLLEIDPDYKSGKEEKLEDMFYGNQENIPIDEVYNFTSGITYSVESNENNKPVNLNYVMLFTKTKDYMAIKMENVNSEDLREKNGNIGITTIMDDHNQVMIMLMEEQKIAQVVSMDKVKDVEIEEEFQDKNVDFADPEIRKTGNSKKILGYHCEEFETVSEDGISKIWITKELPVFHKNMFANLNRSLGGDQIKDYPDDAKGLMMEMSFTGNNGEKTTMKAIDISDKKTSIATTGYKFMNLSRFMK